MKVITGLAVLGLLIMVGSALAVRTPVTPRMPAVEMQESVGHPDEIPLYVKFDTVDWR
jgi:hypothetical protein